MRAGRERERERERERASAETTIIVTFEESE
jgi:hypothetical protein